MKKGLASNERPCKDRQLVRQDLHTPRHIEPSTIILLARHRDGVVHALVIKYSSSPRHISTMTIKYRDLIHPSARRRPEGPYPESWMSQYLDGPLNFRSLKWTILRKRPIAKGRGQCIINSKDDIPCPSLCTYTILYKLTCTSDLIEYFIIIISLSNEMQKTFTPIPCKLCYNTA